MGSCSTSVPGRTCVLQGITCRCCWPQVRVPFAAFPLTYKYAVVDGSGSSDLEAGEARLVSCALPAPPGTLLLCTALTV